MDDLLHLLATNTAFFLGSIFVLGLMVGSFLNVVIYRIPKMMEQEWRENCAEISGESSASDAPKMTLSSPASSCPHCRHKIRFYENIPVISWLVLRGKCSACGEKISARYPIIECITAILSVIVAWHFGYGWQALGGLILTWALIALSVIDIDHQLLPDSITLPFLWLGLAASLLPVFVDSHDAIIGGIAGYMSLWLVFQTFKLLTGKEGMGFGDFKLLALLGAWLGWAALPGIIILSSLVGAVLGVILLTVQKKDHQTPIPFGPYLATAGWISLLWGEELRNAYFQWSGFG